MTQSRTAAEIAGQLREKAQAFRDGAQVESETYGEGTEDQIDFEVQAADLDDAADLIEQQAVAFASAERRTVERCAEIAEGFDAPNHNWLPTSVALRNDIALAIRALPSKPSAPPATLGGSMMAADWKLRLRSRVVLGSEAVRQFPKRDGFAGVVERRTRQPGVVMVLWDGRKMSEQWSEDLLTPIGLDLAGTADEAEWRVDTAHGIIGCFGDRDAATMFEEIEAALVAAFQRGYEAARAGDT